MGEEKEADSAQSGKGKREWSGFSLRDIEIEDEFAMNVTTARELRTVIAQCPSRTLAFSWKLFYGTAIHGISMNTLYANCEGVEESVLLIRDSADHVFGAF